jgi:16S rRNA (guanine527-N7)-methyltransferase
MKKEIFEKFIAYHRKNDRNRIISEFEKYHTLLFDENQKINLVSRKTSKDDYWTIHFLDSLLPLEIFDFSGKRVLDFGSGGGLPGIPLKILFPSAEIYLLESRLKKVESMKKFIKKLDLKKCFTIVSRLEDLKEEWNNFFDVIVCRSVKILPKYKKKLFPLLKKEGRIILYKSKILKDVELFEKYKIYDVSHPEIGERKIVEISKK